MKQGLYEQVINQITNLQLDELNTNEYTIGREGMDPEEARLILSSYISIVTRKALKMVREQISDNKEALLAQIRACNDMIITLKNNLDEREFDDLQISEQGEVLTHIYSKINTIRAVKDIKELRPVTPMSQSSLFTGSKAEPELMNELKHEIISADRIELLVSFIKWSGLRCLMEEFRQFTDRGGKLRVITTTYMEATDYKAVMELSKLPNTEIKISYDIERTRLHAKAYMFHRDTGFTTAYIGSSNLSNPALTSGLEWNIKITEKDSYDVLKKIEATYESYWHDRDFKSFSGADEQDVNQLKLALRRSKDLVENKNGTFSFDIMPFEYQKEVLEKLDAQRKIYGEMRNLVVAATGVGKTVISAFDYKRFRKENGGKARLLFVAHREEILNQSRDTFRYIIKDLNFGELHVGRHKADEIDHLFISIQSFNSMKLSEMTTPNFYDYIVVDEFHHAAAPSYQKLLNYYDPKILLGLTATPERMDGADILEYFNHSIAAEIRLTDAIDRKLLSPFQYFGIADMVDLSKVKWTRRGYDMEELENLYTNNKIRVAQILNSLKRYVTDLNEVKGLGFCVGVEHANYMAKVFNESGIPSLALHGGSSTMEREQAKQLLVSGQIKLIFVVDLYNEGVDIPEINTVLFLRPTQSLTVFLQQLGRGLRLAEGKECLTVLDFIGQAHQDYNFQEKFRAMIGRSRHSIQYYLENGFSHLPRGSYIELEKQAREYVLRNVKQARINRRSIVQRMKYFESDTRLTLTIKNFTNYYGMSLYELYGGRSGKRLFREMMVEAGVKEAFTMDGLEDIKGRIPAILSINSRRWLHFLLRYINEGYEPITEEEQLMIQMFYYTFYRSEPSKRGFNSTKEAIQYILACKEFKEEIVEILTYNLEHIDFVDLPNTFPFACPLDVHCSYTTDQVMAAFGYYNEEKAPAFREGVKHFEDKMLDIFIFTLNKSDKDFSPSTLYEDYAINERLFHWQSQSRTSAESGTAQRYIHHRELGHQIALFVREYKEENQFTSPFIFLGEANYVSHSGTKPVSFVWELKEEMPAALVPVANKVIV
ncbi:DEAD/DEAH box helicase [Paenibacillus sp. Marseille-Q4541]|uniref:DEAD/DEAH box helicase n=1 Tax=Paenibacillus sp. Marseille-Q4541 TaxID=2831522 RepID=UPI001BADC39F|nr:DEAD/DEAH box helicase [Paenibacillus sp. Marseille-Q4541]